MSYKICRILALLTIAIIVLGLLGGCAGTRPTGDYVTSDPIAQTPLDSLVARDHGLDSATVTLPRTPLQRLLGRPAVVQRYARPAGSSAPLIGQTGKRSITTIYQGPVQNVTTGKKGQTLGDGASSVVKPKAATSTGWGDAVNQPRASNAAAVHGDDNWVDQKAPPAPPRRSAWQLLRPWVLGIGGIATLGLVAYNWAAVAGFFSLLFSVFKRKKSTDVPS